MASSVRAALGLLLLTACGGDGPAGPSANGPEFFSATVDGQVWTPILVIASCNHNRLAVNAGRVVPVSGVIETLVLSVENVTAPGRFPLGDTAGGRWGWFVADPGNGAARGSFRTAPPGSGSVRFTGLTLEDSLLAGRFDLVVANDTVPGQTRMISGTFRSHLSPVYTVEEPDGVACDVVPGPT